MEETQQKTRHKIKQVCSLSDSIVKELSSHMFDLLIYGSGIRYTAYTHPQPSS